MSAGKRTHIVIVGAGVTGLTCAFDLIESEAFKSGVLKVTVLEGSGRAGGIIETTAEQGALIESGPDSFITTRPYMRNLAERLGLSDRIIPTNVEGRGAMVVSGGKLVKLPEGFAMLAPGKILPFLESPIISLAGKLRVLSEPFLPVRASTEDESLADFVRRRFGAELLEKIAQPMVGGIYVGDAEKLSAAMAAERFVELEQNAGSVIGGLLSQARQQAQDQAQAHSKISSDDGGDPVASQPGVNASASAGVRYGMFCSFDGGMGILVEALVARLRSASATGNLDFRLSAPVAEITRAEDKGGQSYSIQLADQVLSADHVVLAVPAGRAAAILSSSSSSSSSSRLNELAAELAKIEAASSLVVNFLVNKSDIALEVAGKLDAFGVVIPEVEMHRCKLNSIAVAFASKKFKGRAPGDKLILRVFLGGVKQPEILARPDAELIDMALADLVKLVGLDQSARPLYARVCRWPQSMPQYYVGHKKLLARIDSLASGIDGLHLAGASYRGVGLPECVHSGDVCADKILGHLAKLQSVSVN
ncbi:MAG: protoporphyrinogen oxidase [Cyanobacteria bacterium REEB67]|nr:protoporphyrinogen oxidase [Cyanobacteria bacterium REEB67]